MATDLSPSSPPGAPAWVPSPEQEKAIHAFARCPLDDRLLVLMIESARGEGKFVLYDQLLLTPTGWAKAADIHVGDRLIAADGTPARVLGRYPQPPQALWRVSFSDGCSLVTSDDHLWAVETKWDRNGRRKPPWYRSRARPDTRSRPPRHVRRPRTGPKIVTTRTIRDRLASGAWRTGGRWSIPLLSAPVEFPSRSVPLDPYLVGVLLGDGGLTCGVILTTGDAELVAAVRTLLPATVRLVQRNRLSYSVRGDGRPNPVVCALNELGLMGHRAAEKFVPERYLWNAPSVRLAVLQGLLDTDGTVLRHSNSVSFSTVSEQLAEDVEFLVRSFGGVTRRRMRHTFYSYRGEQRYGQPSYHIAINLPQGVAPFRLGRKVARVSPKGERNRARRFVVGCRPAGTGDGVCFQVDHPSALYVCKEFILTHNTSTAILAQLALAEACEHAGLGQQLPYKTAVIRDTWANLSRTTIQTFRELAHLGLPVRLVNQDHEALIERDGKATNHFFFFGLDRPADADRLQGFSCGCLWIEEAAPAADFATGVPPESLGIGATSVRQEGLPRRILLTQNPPDEDHWTVKIGEALDEAGLADAVFERLSLSPGGKARHFRTLAAEAPDSTDRQRWERAAERFESYRRTSRLLLEAAGRGDLVRRLIEGERGGVQVGEPVVPNFSRKLHVVPHLEFLPGIPVIRGHDTSLHPATVWLQVLGQGAGVNIVAARRSTNLGMTQHLLAEVLPLQDRRGLTARREGPGDLWRGGAGGGWRFRDISDPAGRQRDASDSDRSARLTVEKMLGTSCEFGPVSWPARRDALHAAFERRGRGDRMWVQIAEDECKELILALSGRCHYPIDPSTGRIVGTVEAMKRASGVFHHELDALAYALGKLFPAHEWLRAASLPAPRTPPPKRNWLEV